MYFIQLFKQQHEAQRKLHQMQEREAAMREREAALAAAAAAKHKKVTAIVQETVVARSMYMMFI